MPSLHLEEELLFARLTLFSENGSYLSYFRQKLMQIYSFVAWGQIPRWENQNYHDRKKILAWQQKIDQIKSRGSGQKDGRKTKTVAKRDRSLPQLLAPATVSRRSGAMKVISHLPSSSKFPVRQRVMIRFAFGIMNLSKQDFVEKERKSCEHNFLC